MRRVFAAELRQRGVDADATPQITRGPRVQNDHSKVYQARINVERRNNNGTMPKEIFRRDKNRMKSGSDAGYVNDKVKRIYKNLIEEFGKSSDSFYRKLYDDLKIFARYNFGMKVDVPTPRLNPLPKPSPFGIAALEPPKHKGLRL